MPFISASMMCADMLKLGQDAGELAAAGCEYFHMDVMDGHFVPNMTMGIAQINALRAFGVPFDYHFMAEDIEHILPLFDIREGDLVAIHMNTARHPHRALSMIRDMGAAPGVALSPHESPDQLKYLSGLCRYALVMTVNPGFAGQKLIEPAMAKIAEVKRLAPGILIGVDGSVNEQTAPRMRALGAELFVCGSSSVFKAGRSIAGNIAAFRAALDGNRA